MATMGRHRWVTFKRARGCPARSGSEGPEGSEHTHSACSAPAWSRVTSSEAQLCRNHPNFTEA